MASPQQYANAIVPDQFRVFGVGLQDFCIGHALLLHKVGSPFLPQYSRPSQDGDLLLAIWICSQPWEKARKNLFSRICKLWLTIWGIQIRWTRHPIHVLQATETFRAYLSDAWAGPSSWKHESNDAEEGVPVLASLKIALCMQFGFGHEEALSYPIKAAVFDTACAASMAGSEPLLSEAEEEIFRRASE